MSKIIKSSYVIIQNPNNTQDSSKYVNPIGGNLNSTDYIVGEAYTEKEKILKEALEESKLIINSANEYKNNMLLTVSQEMEEHRKKGFDSGYNEGYEKGKYLGFEEGKALAEKEINKKNENLIAELCRQIYTVEESKDELIKRYEKDLIKLSVDIAEKIIRTKISQNDEIIKDILANAIKDYRNVEWLKIYLSSNDYITISTDKNIMQKLSQISEHVALEVISDAEDGELIIETSENLIDLGVNTQLSNLKSMIT